MIDFAKLTAPFPPDDVQWRVGATNKDKTKGMALAYIDARAVMDRLDEVCGPANWQCRYPHANGKTVCEIGLFIDGQWVWKADGAGDTDYEAEKGALSDSFKRAAVRWGIGRYLYELPAPWVAIEAFGKSYKILDSARDTLASVLTGKRTPKAEPKKPDASAWCEAQIADLARMTTERELAAWLDKYGEALGRLQDKHPALYEQVQGAYETAQKHINQINTGVAA